MVGQAVSTACALQFRRPAVGQLALSHDVCVWGVRAYRTSTPNLRYFNLCLGNQSVSPGPCPPREKKRFTITVTYLDGPHKTQAPQRYVRAQRFCWEREHTFALPLGVSRYLSKLVIPRVLGRWLAGGGSTLVRQWEPNQGQSRWTCMTAIVEKGIRRLQESE
jgi:hypothetical protein